MNPQLRKLQAPPSPLASILVRVLNEKFALEEFWKRLRRQTVFAQLEIVFLDIGSTDGTIEYLLEQPCTLYTAVARTPDDFNYGKNCNRIMELSHAPIAVFLSAHVFLAEPAAVETIVCLLDHAPRPTALYLRQIPNDVLGFTSYEAAYLARRFPPGTAPQPQFSPAGFSNAASALRREDWQAHPFPELHGGEDYAWAEQHLAIGGLLLYSPHLHALHSHNWTPGQVYDRVRLVAQARNEIGSYRRAVFYFLGVFVSSLRHGAGLREAGIYASAHARAYL